MFMLSAMTAEANSRSQPSLNVSSSEKSAGLPSEYLVSLEMEMLEILRESSGRDLLLISLHHSQVLHTAGEAKTIRKLKGVNSKSWKMIQ